MTRSSFEVIGSAGGPGRAPGSRSGHHRSAVGGLAVLGLLAVLAAAGAALTAHRQLEAFLAEEDSQALTQAAQVFGRSIEQQRRYALSAVSVLAEDTRIRAPVMTGRLDEATIHDVLEDLKKSSGASMLAVLDAAGKVRAVAGAQGLRELDLGGSPVVKTASERPSTVVWAFPERVLVVGVAPVRGGGQVAVLLAMGFEIGEPLFGAIQNSLGVAGALLIGDRVVVSSTNDQATAQAIKTAREFEDDKERVVSGGEREFSVRVSRTSDSAAAGKVVWLIPRFHETGRTALLRLLIWIPGVIVALAFALALLLARRDSVEAR